MDTRRELEIVDIHASDDAFNTRAMREEIIRGLQAPSGDKTLPTMLLYDERGLRLYDDITTHAPEYYLFGAEEEILKANADEIVRIMCGNQAGGEGCDGAGVVLELGAG